MTGEVCSSRTRIAVPKYSLLCAITVVDAFDRTGTHARVAEEEDAGVRAEGRMCVSLAESENDYDMCRAYC